MATGRREHWLCRLSVWCHAWRGLPACSAVLRMSRAVCSPRLLPRRLAPAHEGTELGIGDATLIKARGWLPRLAAA